MVSWCPNASFDTHKSIFYVQSVIQFWRPNWSKLTKMAVKIEWLAERKNCFYGCQKKRLDIRKPFSSILNTFEHFLMHIIVISSVDSPNPENPLYFQWLLVIPSSGRRKVARSYFLASSDSLDQMTKVWGVN